MVLYADEESFTLMTPEGHLFAGWITFSASEQATETVAQVQVLMRASDPILELGLTLGGHRQEDRFWATTLGNVAAHFGIADADGRHDGGVRGQAPPVATLDQRVAVGGDPLHALHDGGAGRAVREGPVAGAAVG